MLRIIFVLALMPVLTGALGAEFIDETARGEVADKNRISIYAQLIRSPIRMGLEYERTLYIWGMLKPAIATSVNTGSHIASNDAKLLKSSEYTSYVDVPFRLALMPIQYFHVFVGGGATLYSTTVKLSDHPNLAQQVDGSAAYAGVAPFAELGARISYGAYSLGASFGTARIPAVDIKYSYASGSQRITDSYNYTPFMVARFNVFFGFLF